MVQMQWLTVVDLKHPLPTRPAILRRVPTACGGERAPRLRQAETPNSGWGDAATWNREYAEIRAIPSSLRFAPSRAFKRLERSLGDLSMTRVLDIGAGAGRHAIYAASKGAEVHAIDSSDVACGMHAARLRACGMTLSIAVEHGVLDVNNLADGKYDVIIDSYVSCHILSAADRHVFLEALMSRLTTGGRIYTAGMGDTDSFYRRHVVCRQPPDTVALDPQNGVPKLLQPRDISVRDGHHLGTLIACTTERFAEAVDGRNEIREVHASVLSR